MAFDVGTVMRSFRGWMPIRVWMSEDGPLVHWFRFPARAGADAYFSDTVARAAKRPFNLAFGRTTSIDDAMRVASEREAIVPAGFIFHMSRCGSTLVSKSLGLVPATHVIAEAGPINDVLTLSGIDDETRIAWLRAIVTLLTPATLRGDARVVVKLDAWNARSLDVVLEAFPDVPWVFIHRDPVEVLASHMRTFSYMMSAANAPAALGMPITDAIRIGREEYCARVLAEILESIRRFGASPQQCVSYTELPDALWSRVAPAFGMTLSDRDVARIRENAKYHAKRPEQLFTADGDEKRAAASPGIVTAVANFVAPVYTWFKGPGETVKR